MLNGDLPTHEVLRPFLSRKIPVIAADGAAWSLKDLQINPNIIVGDLDSLKSKPDYETSFRNSEIIERPDQNSNDFQKSLVLIADRNLAPVMVVGMQGGDLEHSFNNWSVAIKLGKQFELWIMEGNRAGIGIFGGGLIKASSEKDKIVSLIPQPEAVLSTEGLFWPLKKERLALGYREGARNEIADKDFSVEVHSGSLMIFSSLDSEISELQISR